LISLSFIHFALVVGFLYEPLGFGNMGELARSAKMTNPDANGKYNLRKEYFYDLETGNANLQIVYDQFLNPLPPIWPHEITTKQYVMSVATGHFHLLVVACDGAPTSTISNQQNVESRLYASGTYRS
jgi:hypothetical protein